MQQIILDYKIRSKDGGIKYSWKLNDEEIIESVFLKFDKKYFGICFSTQAGCKNNCVFCSNSVLGLSRNLTFKEIFQEVFKTLNYNKSKIPNGSLIDIAFMGVGEPLDNSDNVYKAIAMFKNKLPKKYNYEYSISTIGNTKKIKELVDKYPDVKLQISLNSTNQKKRSSLMPSTLNQNIVNIISAAKYYQKRSSNNVLLNYLMIKDINDTIAEAKDLAKLIKDTGIGVMISRLNPTNLNTFLEPSTSENIENFKKVLIKNGIQVIDFFSLSSDIGGGCGQLRYIKQSRDRFNKIYNLEIDKTWSESSIPEEIITLVNKIKLNKNAKIFDIGCGRGRLLKYLKNQGYKNIYGVDISERAIKDIKNLNIKQADASVKIPFKKHYFDIIFDMTMIGSIEVENWNSIFKEIYRVLKPHGYFISEMFKNKSNVPIEIIRKNCNAIDKIYGINKIGYQKITKPYFKLIYFLFSKNQTECQYYLFQKK